MVCVSVCVYMYFVGQCSVCGQMALTRAMGNEEPGDKHTEELN